MTRLFRSPAWDLNFLWGLVIGALVFVVLFNHLTHSLI